MKYLIKGIWFAIGILLIALAALIFEQGRQQPEWHKIGAFILILIGADIRKGNFLK